MSVRYKVGTWQARVPTEVRSKRNANYFEMWKPKRTLSFIKDFRQSECLWNMKRRDYKDREKKEYTLMVLADKYQCEVKDVERKINSLRSQFRREHKRVARIRKGSSSSRRSVWFAYKSLLFLKQEAEAIEDQNCPAIEDAEENCVKVEAPATSSSEETEEEWERDSFQHPSALKINRRFESSIEVKATHCLKKLTEIVCNRDDFSTYGDYIATKMRNSGRSKKEIAIAQYHMEEIVFNLVMGFYSEEQQYAQTFMEPETYMTPQIHRTPQGRASYTHISSETQTIPVPSSTNMDYNN